MVGMTLATLLVMNNEDVMKEVEKLREKLKNAPVTNKKEAVFLAWLISELENQILVG